MRLYIGNPGTDGEWYRVPDINPGRDGPGEILAYCDEDGRILEAFYFHRGTYHKYELGEKQ